MQLNQIKQKQNKKNRNTSVWFILCDNFYIEQEMLSKEVILILHFFLIIYKVFHTIWNRIGSKSGKVAGMSGDVGLNYAIYDNKKSKQVADKTYNSEFTKLMLLIKLHW